MYDMHIDGFQKVLYQNLDVSYSGISFNLTKCRIFELF